MVINKDYQGILEKTNNQLSLWYRPYNIIISLITFLFTAGAALVGYFIFHQIQILKDQEKESKKAITKQGDIELKRVINEVATKQIEEKEKEKSSEHDEDKKRILARDIVLARYAQSTTSSPFGSIPSGQIFINPSLSTQIREELLRQGIKIEKNEKKDSKEFETKLFSDIDKENE